MVYIIGTGPGDEDLLTVKAIKALSKCTAVLYDRLAGNNILNYLNDECEIYYCGKEPGCHYKTQDEINENIVELAKKGHIVGRIKGGDPYVFGRGGEEVLRLLDDNIPFEVVPGVTSPISVLNYAGIPITQRGMAQSFHIITGMTAGVSKINFEALAKVNGTLVFMMGLDNLENIVANLIKNGMDTNTPCATIMRGTTSKQRKVVGTLNNIHNKVIEAKLKSPCIIVVGEVVTLHESLSWYDKLPLFGANICITRSKDQSQGLKCKLKELGSEVTEVNSIEFLNCSSNLDSYINKLLDYDVIVLNSVNAINVFFDYLLSKNYDIRNLKARFAVVGEATKAALRSRGIIESYIGEDFYESSLLKVLKSELKQGEKVLIPSSTLSKDTLKEELKQSGCYVDKVAIYETICGKIKNERAFEEVDVVTYTSPSTVKNMIKLVGVDKLKEKINVCIGPVTYKELIANGLNGYESNIQSEEGLVSKLVEIWSDVNVK